jgi:hypothetical protein
MHPVAPTKTAYFGRLYIKDGNGVSIETGVKFVNQERLGVDLWFPMRQPANERTYFTHSNIYGDFMLYANDEIERGMKENSNANYGLVKAIMDGVGAQQK